MFARLGNNLFGSVAVCPGFNTTTALTASPQVSSGMPNTADSSTAGCWWIAASTCVL